MIIWFFVIISLLSGCTYPVMRQPSVVHQTEIGKPIDPAKVAQIKEGKTTEYEVVGLLGVPQQTHQAPNGVKVFLYQHGLTQFSGPSASSLQGGMSNECLMITIRNNVVQKIMQNSSYQPTSSFTGIVQ